MSRVKYSRALRAWATACAMGGLVLAASTSAVLHAADEQTCRAYADQAVKDAILGNESGQCGFTGPRWSNSRQAHYDFCRRSEPSVVDSERNARQGEIGCCAYSTKALNQVLKQRNLGCGFTGPRWTEDIRSHVSWCTSRPFAFQGSEMLARERELAECQSSKGPGTPIPPGFGMDKIPWR